MSALLYTTMYIDQIEKKKRKKKEKKKEQKKSVSENSNSLEKNEL
jgi:hypothetical protein